MNIASNMEAAALQFPDQMALRDEARIMSYQELNTEANRIASALRDLGLRPGDHVAVLAPNSCTWVAFYFGVLKSGAVPVTLPHSMTKAELDPILDDCRPNIVFTNAPERYALDDKDYIRHLIADQGDTGLADLVSSGSDRFDTIERASDDTGAILYTGGTTGVPKGVMLTHANLTASARTVSRYERSTHEDRALCFLPLNHVFGQIHIMHSTILTGGGLVLLSSFDMPSFLAAIDRFAVSKLYAVPTVFTRLLSLNDLPDRLRPVRYCFSAAASMAKELVNAWKERTGLDIYEAYGMTESASMVTFNHYDRHVVGSVGTPVQGVEVQIRDQAGNVLGTNQKGEICISGPNIMKGYLNRPQDTARAFWGKWFRSGDVGLMDEDSYLFIVDRIKELIISGGENVSPREVEEALYGRREIEECAVIGLPDQEYGERVVAYIVTRQQQLIDPAELKAYLKTRLSPFKVPKAFIPVSDLPKSSAGKLLKRTLKEQVLQGTIKEVMPQE
ncbi:MAG: AMP-binding protein [Desulfohalobiaceae bacterium]|nr:AMP-binding protein [Desulfohalobiaceae bacterium]